jgi:hypothetical protein
MPVLTYKDINEKGKKKSSFLKSPKKELFQVEEEIPKKRKIPLTIYVLLHPENGMYDRQNFQDVVKINNKDYERECKNGLVRTTEIVLKDYLITQGYLLIDTIEDKGEKDDKIYRK